eukprot:2685935-Amphidinium_carterae.1
MGLNRFVVCHVASPKGSYPAVAYGYMTKCAEHCTLTWAQIPKEQQNRRNKFQGSIYKLCNFRSNEQ